MDLPAALKRSRVYAMARPCRPIIEQKLLSLAVDELGLTGSRRAQARALALEVAEAAIAALRSVPGDLSSQLRVAEIEITRPAIWRLATDPTCGIEGVACAEAVRQFEALGCRRLPASEWSGADRDLVNAVAQRLIERFRKRLQKKF